MRPIQFAWAVLVIAPALVRAAIYEVGPQQPYAAIGEVPWESLAPGDTVLIHWRTAPYAEKWVIGRQGTAAAPITIRGLAGPSGQLPVIDGRNATTRRQLAYWNQNRAVIKIGGANTPPDAVPAFLVLENLEIRSARPPYAFTNTAGVAELYPNNAAAVYVEKGDQVTVRGCVLQDCGNGLFVAHAARDVLVEGNEIHGNGNAGSAFEHNSYTAAERITFQFNRYGPLRADCLGNALKDRSAGLTVRYNWIEGGNRQLDLVDAEDSVALQQSPLYRTTCVYGNILIEPDGAGNSQIVHYGGDSGTTTAYRQGTLYFHHNTVVSTRTGNTTLFRLSTNDESCDCRNNILFVTAAGNRLAMLDSAGRLLLTHNWLKAGFVTSHSGLTGAIANDGSNLTGASPGFLDLGQQDFRLATHASGINAATNLAPAIAADHAPAWQYAKHRTGRRRVNYLAPDLGAYEFSPFAAWQNSQFNTNASNPAVASEWADPDGDGLLNLFEYAFGLDPLVASRAGVPQPRLVDQAGQPHLGIEFPRRPIPAELTYTVQVSPDLQAWLEGVTYADAVQVVSNGLTADVGTAGLPLVRLNDPITHAGRRFLRVSVRADWW
jgi:hypothetical protein